MLLQVESLALRIRVSRKQKHKDGKNSQGGKKLHRQVYLSFHWVPESRTHSVALNEKNCDLLKSVMVFYKEIVSLNIKDYGNVTVETRTILDQDPCYKNGNEDEEIQWYPGNYVLNGEIKGTFRHLNCVFATYKGIFIDGTCSFYAPLPKMRSFQRRLERRFRSDNSVDPQIRSHIPFENRNKEELVDSIKCIKSQEEELKKRNFF